MDGGFHGFITGPAGMGIRDLGTLGGSYTISAGINNAERVVGETYVGSGSRAFITGPAGRGMRDLGTPAGATMSGAEDINDAGQVVGWSVQTLLPLTEPSSPALMEPG